MRLYKRGVIYDIAINPQIFACTGMVVVEQVCGCERLKFAFALESLSWIVDFGS